MKHHYKLTVSTKVSPGTFCVKMGEEIIAYFGERPSARVLHAIVNAFQAGVVAQRRALEDAPVTTEGPKERA